MFEHRRTGPEKAGKQSHKAEFLFRKRIYGAKLQPDHADEVCGLYQTFVESVMLFGCENWGYADITDLETQRLAFIKNKNKLRRCTPTSMLYMELGILPIRVSVDIRMIGLWALLVDTQTRDKLSKQVFVL